MTEPEDLCPVCGQTYSKKTNLSSRHGRQHDIRDAYKLCQDAERRGSSRAMKKTRADTEKYRFIGYIHND